MKYQTSITQCLKVSSKVKVSDRFTEWQKDGTTEWQTAVNIDSSSILKKTSSFSPKSFSESMIIRTLLSWQIYIQKYPKAVSKYLTQY